MKKESIFRLYQLLIVPFALMVSFSIAITSYFTWHYSESFAIDSGQKINRQTLTSIETEINYYFHHAAMTNNGVKRVIQHGLLDINDQDTSFTYLQEILQPDITMGIVDNLHIGYPNGNYLGVENSNNGLLKRVANDSNDHNLQVIHTETNIILEQQEKYTALNSGWYQTALASQQRSWSNPYPIFGTHELGMTLSEAVYDNDGHLICVLGSDILLNQFNKHINAISPTDNSYLFIVDKDNHIIAQSGKNHYPNESGLESIENTDNPTLQQAIEFFNTRQATEHISELHKLTIDGITEKYWVSYIPFGVNQGLDWHIGIILPESDLFGHERAIEIRTFKIWVVAFIVCIIIGLLITNFINYSIQHLHDKVNDIDKTGSMFEHSDSPIKEVNDLSVAFSNMSRQVLELFLDLKNTNKELEKIVEQRTSELKNVNTQLNELAHTDNLTKLMNRRGFEEKIQQLWHKLENSEIEMISCIMADIDSFKLYNDTYGHQSGDQCIKEVSKCIIEIIEPIGYASRLGGEEFVILLPDISENQVRTIAEKIITQLAQLNINHSASMAAGHVTLSLGLSFVNRDNKINSDDLLDKADQALYQAKKQGKNCYVVYQDNRKIDN